ncbi:unnamed protein product, partial [Symbiodinium sp. CCMP2456]
AYFHNAGMHDCPRPCFPQEEECVKFSSAYPGMAKVAWARDVGMVLALGVKHLYCVNQRLESSTSSAQTVLPVFVVLGVMTERLRRHAARFHSKRQRKHVVRKYFKALRSFDTAAAQQHAAHVAGWLAYGPEDYSPNEAELRLLSKFLDRLGTGVLPARLQQVLPDVLRVLQSPGVSRAEETWAQAADALTRKLRKFRCCRQGPADGRRPVNEIRSSAEKSTVQPMDQDVSKGDQQPAARGTQPTQALLPAPCGLQQLFRKKAEWTNMHSTERAECLLRAEAVVFSEQDIVQGRLSEVLHQVAAALAPPRKATWQLDLQDNELEQDLQETCLDMSASCGGLQRRARKLLLKVLRAWRTSQFDCGCIRHLLEHVKRQIGCFEEKSSQLYFAAAATTWLAIQREVELLLESVDESDGLPVRQRQPRRSESNWVGNGVKKTAMLTAMQELGGRATYKELLEHVRRNPHVFGNADQGTIERSLRSFRAPAYFEVRGKENGEDIFGLADPCPKGVRRQTRGFTARMNVGVSCCVGAYVVSSKHRHQVCVADKEKAKHPEWYPELSSHSSDKQIARALYMCQLQTTESMSQRALACAGEAARRDIPFASVAVSAMQDDEVEGCPSGGVRKLDEGGTTGRNRTTNHRGTHDATNGAANDASAHHNTCAHSAPNHMGTHACTDHTGTNHTGTDASTDHHTSTNHDSGSDIRTHACSNYDHGVGEADTKNLLHNRERTCIELWVPLSLCHCPPASASPIEDMGPDYIGGSMTCDAASYMKRNDADVPVFGTVPKFASVRLSVI